MKKSAIIFLSAIIALSFSVFSGCNTVAGFGKDVQQGGKALTKAADRNK